MPSISRKNKESLLRVALRHYWAAALWSSVDENGNPLDDNFCIDGVSFASLLSSARDMKDFLASANSEEDPAGEYDSLFDAYCARVRRTDANPSIACFAHDFWLTRNGHGVGFWDRGLGKVGSKLTDMAKVYGGVDLYVGDNGKIYG